MEIGIGLPNSIPGATGADLLDWAKLADAAGFSSLGTIGAVSYPSYEELTALAAAAAVTTRIRLFPDVLLAPTRSTAELAKQAATVDQLSGGRLVLGLGVGWRESDFALTGRDYHRRGETFDRMLSDLTTAWRGEPLATGTREVAPRPVQEGGVPILVGGMTDAAVRRAARHAGWTAGGTPPEMTAMQAEKVRAAWRAAGREGEPRIAQLVYFSLGDTEERSNAYLFDYYKVMGDDVARMIAGGALRSPEAILGARQAYADIGVDELIYDPTVSDPEQVTMLADVVLGS